MTIHNRRRRQIAFGTKLTILNRHRCRRQIPGGNQVDDSQPPPSEPQLTRVCISLQAWKKCRSTTHVTQAVNRPLLNNKLSKDGCKTPSPHLTRKNHNAVKYNMNPAIGYQPSYRGKNLSPSRYYFRRPLLDNMLSKGGCKAFSHLTRISMISRDIT